MHSKMKMINILIFLLISIFIITVPLIANNKSQDVVVNIDYAKFKYDSTRTLLEIYYFVFINPSTVENENNYNVNIDFEILNNYTDSLLANQTISILQSLPKRRSYAKMDERRGTCSR